MLSSIFSRGIPSGIRHWGRTTFAILGLMASHLSLADWTLPALDLSAVGQNANDAQVAVDGSGNAIAVWQRFDGSDHVIQSVRYSASTGTWSAVTTLSPTGQIAAVPQVAMDGSGNAIAVWELPFASPSIVQATRYSAGTGTWSTPINLSAPGQSAGQPQVAVDGSGNAIAVWTRSSDHTIQGVRYAAGTGTWGTAATLPGSGSGSQYPQVAVDGSGNAIAVWIESDGSNAVIQSARYSAGTWSAATTLSAPGENAGRPQVAINGSGNAVTVWFRSDGSTDIIQSRLYSAGSGTWGAATDLSAVGEYAHNPQVALDGNGNAIAVWVRFDGSNEITQTARYSAGLGNWSTPTDLSAAGNDSYTPQVALDGGGNAIAVWLRWDGFNHVVQSALYNASGDSWSALADLSAAGRDAFEPQIAMHASGYAVSVWKRLNSANFIVQSAPFGTPPAAPLATAATPVPTLSQWGTILLSSLLGLSAAFSVRRRFQHDRPGV